MMDVILAATLSMPTAAGFRARAPLTGTGFLRTSLLHARNVGRSSTPSAATRLHLQVLLDYLQRDSELTPGESSSRATTGL